MKYLPLLLGLSCGLPITGGKYIDANHNSELDRGDVVMYMFDENDDGMIDLHRYYRIAAVKDELRSGQITRKIRLEDCPELVEADTNYDGHTDKIIYDQNRDCNPEFEGTQLEFFDELGLIPHIKPDKNESL